VTPEEWAELEAQGKMDPWTRNTETDLRGWKLLQLSRLEDSHPAGFDGPCDCRACRAADA
jgi:hypothetical protein